MSQTRDGVWNGDGGQTAAVIEAAFSQTRDGVRNGDGGQIAINVFATYCSPICYDLNDRKVLTQILLRIKNDLTFLTYGNEMKIVNHSK